MNSNRQDAQDSDSNFLGDYLRDRRARVDLAALGLSAEKRRTPGLRREEVAQRANISPTWYAWLEQGRGGAPSADALSRIADALTLNEVEREHLFFLAFGRPPQVSYKAVSSVEPRIQRLIDSLETTPAIVYTTATYDVVAWNRAAALVLIDYAQLPPSERNMLKLIFRHVASMSPDEEQVRIARLAVNSFRVDVARSGATFEINQLVAELCEISELFEKLWGENEVRVDDEATVLLHHPLLGSLEMEYSRFDVDSRSELSMNLHRLLDPAVSERVRELVQADAQ